MKENYYTNNLNSQGLYKVYDTDIPRIKQYLDAEISFVKGDMTGVESVLELGAGYGRMVKELADSCKNIMGIDISENSVRLGENYLKDNPNANMVIMDVHELDFDENFDMILCLQNGLSAMGVTRPDLIQKLLGMLKEGGRLYFSTYSEKFWHHRIMWFKEQADKGLLGELDMDKTKDGVIICKDGFKAITHTPEDLISIGKSTGCRYQLKEVDESSLFLIIYK